MINTIMPDSKGRVFILAILKKQLNWEPGQGVEIEFIRTVDLPNKEVE